MGRHLDERRGASRGRRRPEVSWVAACAAWAGASLALPAGAQTLDGVAQARHEEGLRLYEAGDYEAALEEFEQAVATRSSPVPRLYIARCLRHLGRFAEAIEEFHRTFRAASDLSRADPYYEQIRDAAERERESILPNVGWITIHVDEPPPGLSLHLDLQELSAQALDLPLPVDPGSITVRAEAPGTEPVSRTLEIAADQRETVRFALAPVERPEPGGGDGGADEPALARAGREARRHRTAMMAGTFASVAVAAAGVVATGLLWASADAVHADLLDRCPGYECAEDEWNSSLEADRDRGEAFATGFYAALGLTAAAVVATVILAALTPWQELDEALGASPAGQPRVIARW